MDFLKSSQYDKDFVKKNMMGPNSMLLLEELLEGEQIERGMRVLDLGCGKGLTSIFLAKEFGVQVFAVDLWVSATDNYKRFQMMQVEDLVIPIHADANNLPFADEYFDAIISVDAYQYFGNTAEYFDQCLHGLLKKGALVALAFPGMKYEMNGNIPEEMREFWDSESFASWHSASWWEAILSKSLKINQIKEMRCFDLAWKEWLSSDNPHAIEDRAMLSRDNGRYMNLISLTGRVY